MEEGTSKAIPLRRPRGAAQALASRPLQLTERLGAGVPSALLIGAFADKSPWLLLPWSA